MDFGPRRSTIRDILESSGLGAILQEGITEIIKNRPEDPLKFLGEYLLANRHRAAQLAKLSEELKE